LRISYGRPTARAIRVFTESEIGAIKVIECLKSTGLSIKEIKQYMGWYKDGDSTLQKRRDLFYQRLEAVKEQQRALDKTMDIIKFKCRYYDTAVEAGTEAVIKGKPHDEFPDDMRRLAKAFSE
jgi:DNA-binding transcriptional MerR regulator